MLMVHVSIKLWEFEKLASKVACGYLAAVEIHGRYIAVRYIFKGPLVSNILY